MSEDYCNSNKNFALNYNKRPPLVFWFDAPPRAGAGSFKYVTENWGNDVYYFCFSQLRIERRTGGWQEANHGKARVIILDKLTNPDLYLTKFFNRNSEAIHVFNGFRSKTSKYLIKYINIIKNPKIIVWSERPGVYGNKLEIFLKKFYHPLIYNYYYYKYSKQISALMPLGKLGVEVFSKFGWKKSLMFPFMYDPPEQKGVKTSNNWNKSETVKFLYVGRFARSTKGIDILIKSFTNLDKSNYKLNLVGGYGEFKDKTIEWAENTKNVEFIGTWPSDKVTENISDYDVVVVPSRFDGWNVVINEALRANVGVIASNETVSHELITASKAGAVVRAGDVDELRTVIESVLNKPEIVNIWKDRAKEYSVKIQSDVVGAYLIDVLDHVFIMNHNEKPSSPW